MSTTTCNITPTAQRGTDGLAILGRTLHDLRGIRFADGETGGQGTGQTGAGSGDTGQGAQGQQTGQTQTGKAGTGDDAPWTKDDFDPERAHRLVQNLRADITKLREGQDAAIKAAVEEAQKQFAQTLGGALGLTPQVETDPVKLQAAVTDLTSKVADADTKLTKAAADIKARDLSLAVALIAPGLGANTKLLLANEQFKTSIASAEPTDEAALTAAITKALQENAALKQPPARAGHEQHTGPTVQSLEAQLAEAEKAKDWRTTMRLKRQIADAKAARGA